MPKNAIKSSSLYDVQPGVAMAQKWIAELKPKTGRSLEEWIALVKKEGPKDYQARWAWLKSKHKLGTNSAWWIAERADGKGGEEDSPAKYMARAAGYVEERYSGKKSALATIISTPTSRNGFAQSMTSTSELVCLALAPASRNQESK